MRTKLCAFAGAMLLSAVLSAASPLDALRKSFVEASVVSFAPDSCVTGLFLKYSDYGRANDVLLLQLYMAVHLPDAEVERLLAMYDSDRGCWTDIDYAARDRGRWPATLHVTRMYALAKLYKSHDSRWHGSERLKKLLHSSMAFWFRTMPVCPNWWHNDIGVPKKMTAVLLMLRDELDDDEIAGGLKVLERSKFGRTGQNKVWLAGNNLMKGLLTDDTVLVRQARDYMAEEIFVTDHEGIQADWSFHQHGPQIQFGNYGLAYADGLAFWLRVLKGSEYDFSPEQAGIVCNLFKEGICWSVWRGVMDPSFCGRQNFMDGGTGKAFALAVAAQNMAEAVDAEHDFFMSVAIENLMPENYVNSLVGAKYYWRSDCGIWRTPLWYASIRMHSERTIGFEMTNRENTLANFSADGALLLMQDAAEFENIFAYWDWRKVPGVTAYDDGRPIKSDDSDEAKRNHSYHVGGAVSDSGDVMVSTMELDRDGLYALKSAFFFGDCVVNLGAGIKASNPDFKSVTTAVDQVHLAGETVSGDGWVHHNGRGYISIDGMPMRVSTGLQRGKWDDIEPSFHDRWDEGEVFKCWFEHPLEQLAGDGVAGSYAYMVLPCLSAEETAANAKRIFKGSRKALVRILQNDSACQAVEHGETLCAVFHEAGLFELGRRSFDVPRPCILIVCGSGSKTVEIPQKSTI